MEPCTDPTKTAVHFRWATRYELWSLYFVSKEISGSHLRDCYKGPVKAATMEKMIPPQEILTKTGRNIPSGHFGSSQFAQLASP